MKDVTHREILLGMKDVTHTGGDTTGHEGRHTQGEILLGMKAVTHRGRYCWA